MCARTTEAASHPSRRRRFVEPLVSTDSADSTCGVCRTRCRAVQALAPAAGSRHARGIMSQARIVRRTVSIVLVAAVASGAGVAAAAPETPTPAPAPLGITYAGWKGDYRAAAKRLDAFKAIGFQIVSFVP